MKHVPTVDIAKQLDREKVSFVREAGEHLKEIADARAKHKYDLELKAFMMRRKHEELVKYHGKTDFMLPTELKMRGREKLYNVRSALHEPDPTLVEATKDSYKEGSDFILGIEKFIFKQYEWAPYDQVII